MMDFVIRNIQLLLVGAAVLGSGVYALLGLRRRDEEPEAPLRLKYGHGKRAAIGLVVSVLAVSTIGFIPAGYRGVIYDAGRGVVQTERPEGLTLMVPFWQRLHNVNVRTLVYEYESFIQTKDLQEVTLPLAINYHIDPDAAAQLFQEVGHGYVETIIQPAAFQASTQAAGLIAAKDIAVSRAELSEGIRAIIEPQLGRHGINVEFVSVKDAVFDESFIAQIKANEIALQRIVESERLVAVAENEANATVRTATGEAQAERVRGEGTADANAAIDRSLSPGVLEWQRLTKWNGQLPVTLLTGEDESVILNLP